MSITSRLRRLRPQPSLEQIFEQNQGRLIHKWMHYFDIYERHFSPFRHRAPRILEIGISHGGSLDLWRRWFGDDCHIVGVDIDPRTTTLARPGIEIRVGDQGDPEFLASLARNDGPFDIVIDDGSHVSSHQIMSLEALWPVVNVGGVYLVEDLHANYWDEYDGGIRKPGTFIEYVKPLLDDLHAFHSHEPGFSPSTWTRTLGGLHVYDSIVVLDRADRSEPHHRMTGRPVFDTLYGEQPEKFLIVDEQQTDERANRTSERALRALRSPVGTARRLASRHGVASRKPMP